MIKLTQSQHFILLLMKTNPKNIYKKRYMLALLSIGIWELHQLDAIKLKKKNIVSYPDINEDVFTYNFQINLLKLIEETNPKSVSYIIEKHIVFSSKQFKSYIQSILDSLIEHDYIKFVHKNKFSKSKYILTNKSLELENENIQLVDYILYKLNYNKEAIRSTSTSFELDHFSKKFIDTFFDEYRFNKLEWVAVAIVSLFIGD